ncbi:MAG: hypothetical protein U0V75_07230 [Ferruginibacter sp.]
MMVFQKKVLFAAAVLVGFSTQAQTTKAIIKRTPVTDSVVKFICGCLTQRKDSINSQQQLFASLSECLQEGAGARMDTVLSENGFIQSDDRKTRAAALREAGRRIGARVAAECETSKELLKLYGTEAPKKELHQP